MSSALPPSGPGEPAQVDDPFGEGVPVEMVLHREEVVIETRLVPYARVRVVRALEGVETEVRAEVAHEEVVVERHWAWSTAAQQDGGGGVPARSVAADSQPPGDGLD